MSSSWYKNLSNKIKNFKNKIYEIENNVLNEKEKFKEIFEKNIALEKEIFERTEELNQANKSLLTLKDIWSTMNSSEPLSEVLSTVVQGLSSGLGYLFCSIFQVHDMSKNQELRVRALSQDNFALKLQDILKNPINTYQISLENKDNIMVQTLKNKDIRGTKSFKNIFNGSNPFIEEEKLEQIDALFGNRTISILPITVQEKPFGCLVVVSIRNELSDTERNFLNLFVGQIELAVTIAGLFEQIREQAITDSLTGLYNRRHFDQCLTLEADRSLRLKQPFTLVTLDLDHLKFINDTYGHPAGDAAICHIGKILKQNARSVDIPARFGGEEFAVILPGIDIDGGLIAAERLRIAIEAEPTEGIGVITASIGVATFLKHTESPGELLELVDQAMYKAKRNGRNQVQTASKQDQLDWQIVALDMFIEILTKRHIPVSQNIANDLIHKLKTTPVQEKSFSDFLYFIVDSLAQTYNSVYESNYTRQKINIVCELAEKINLPKAEIDKLVLATLLHDLGNLMTPEKILLKPGPLTENERQEILEHPIVTAREILKPIKSAHPIIFMVEHYREHWDGSGYPGNLSGDNIPVGSRIISLTSAYFAMISDRPYRKALSHEEAVQILREGSGSSWDAKLVDIFIEILQKEKKPV